MKKLTLVILIFLLTGCYNYKEINNLALVSSLAINYSENDFEVIIEVQENNKDDKYSSYLLKGTGTTIESAMQSASLSLNKDLYFINLDVLLISTEVANFKLNKLLDFIIRDNNFSFDYNIAICDKSEEVINNVIETEEIFGTYIKNVYENTNNNLINVKIQNLLEMYLNDYQDIILPIFDFDNETILMEKAAIYDKLKIVDHLNSEEIALYNILNNNFMNYYLNYTFEKQKAVFKGNNYITQMIYQNNEIKIFSQLEGLLVETENFDVKNKNDLDKISDTFEDSINNLILKLYITNSDILGFKNIIHKQNKNIDSSLSNIKYQIETKLVIDDDSLIIENIGDNL